jgi:hypothetical protein
MTQNRSSAVMQQRREPHHSLDDFPTMPWATRALCEWLVEHDPALGFYDVREPAANRGYMARTLFEYFERVQVADIFDYGVGYEVADYLFGPLPPKTHWTITNPPFRLAEQFIARALATSEVGVAVIVRSAFLEGVGRFKTLFGVQPPTHILQFSERVVMHKGKLSPKGSTATAYCWLVWDKLATHQGTAFEWIAPCRKRLERPRDYDLPEPLRP